MKCDYLLTELIIKILMSLTMTLMNYVIFDIMIFHIYVYANDYKLEIVQDLIYLLLMQLFVSIDKFVKYLQNVLMHVLYDIYNKNFVHF